MFAVFVYDVIVSSIGFTANIFFIYFLHTKDDSINRNMSKKYDFFVEK